MISRSFKCIIVMLMALSAVSTSAQSLSEKQQIRQALTKLSNMVGDFKVVAQLNGVEEVGTAVIQWYLDSTYLHASFNITVPSTRVERKYVSLITFNSSQNQYESTTIYANTSFKVIHTGRFDDSAKMFHREAVNVFPNRIEYVVNEIDLSKAGRWVYRSFQGPERNPKKLVYEGVYTILDH